MKKLNIPLQDLQIALKMLVSKLKVNLGEILPYHH